MDAINTNCRVLRVKNHRSMMLSKFALCACAGSLTLNILYQINVTFNIFQGLFKIEFICLQNWSNMEESLITFLKKIGCEEAIVKMREEKVSS